MKSMAIDARAAGRDFLNKPSSAPVIHWRSAGRRLAGNVATMALVSALTAGAYGLRDDLASTFATRHALTSPEASARISERSLASLKELSKVYNVNVSVADSNEILGALGERKPLVIEASAEGGAHDRTDCTVFLSAPGNDLADSAKPLLGVSLAKAKELFPGITEQGLRDYITDHEQYHCVDLLDPRRGEQGLYGHYLSELGADLYASIRALQRGDTSIVQYFAAGRSIGLAARGDAIHFTGIGVSQLLEDHGSGRLYSPHFKELAPEKVAEMADGLRNERQYRLSENEFKAAMVLSGSSDAPGAWVRDFLFLPNRLDAQRKIAQRVLSDANYVHGGKGMKGSNVGVFKEALSEAGGRVPKHPMSSDLPSPS